MMHGIPLRRSCQPLPVVIVGVRIQRTAAAPSPAISSHDPGVNRECAAVVTNTGSSPLLPSSSGILAGGNHRSTLRGITRRPGQPVRRIRPSYPPPR